MCLKLCSCASFGPFSHGEADEHNDKIARKPQDHFRKRLLMGYVVQWAFRSPRTCSEGLAAAFPGSFWKFPAVQRAPSIWDVLKRRCCPSQCYGKAWQLTCVKHAKFAAFVIFVGSQHDIQSVQKSCCNASLRPILRLDSRYVMQCVASQVLMGIYLYHGMSYVVLSGPSPCPHGTPPDYIT